MSSIAIDPTDARHILIGAAGGGVWETTDRGAHWEPVTDDQPSLFIGAVAFDPQDPSIAYAGTGEGNAGVGEYSAGRWLGVGLLKLSKPGAGWKLVSRRFEREAFYDLKVDAQKPSNLWAATTAGLFRSSDGEKWDCISESTAWNVSIAKLADGSTEVFAATRQGLLRSHDGGRSWSLVILPHAPSGFTRVAVCHAPSDPAVAYVFGAADAAYLWRRGRENGVFESIDGLPSDVQIDQSSYDWCAAVADEQGSTEILYLGAKEVYRGMRPANGRFEWATISKRESGDSIHPDQHVLVPSPMEPNTLYVGCDGGLYRSEDAGLSWTSLNQGLAISEFEFVAQHPTFDAWLLGGTQDNGTLRFEGHPAWVQVAGGDGGDCAIDESRPATCYHGFFDMGLQRSDAGGGEASWNDVGPKVPPEETSTNRGSLFYPPAAVFGETVVQAAMSVYVSRDRGLSWRKIPLPAGQLASSLALASSDVIYVGTISGEVHSVDFADGAWQSPVPRGRPAAGFVSDLATDPQQPSRIWVTYSSVERPESTRVFRSDDGGARWWNVSSSFPKEIQSVAVNVVEVDPAHSDRVYLGLDVGVWRSMNALAGEGEVTWSVFGAGLPNALIKDLKFHKPSRLLRAATQSRGIWEITVDGDQPAKPAIYLRDCAVDRGRREDDRIGADDPFLSAGAGMFWWQSPDIKMDAYPFQTSSAAVVDSQFFADDKGAAANGLRHVNPWPNRNVRVYVQIHNLGQRAAEEVETRLFYTDAALALPDLPASFWTQWDKSGTLPDSQWKEVISSQRAAPARIESCSVSNVPVIVPFEWTVPDEAAATVAFLALVRAKDDPLDGKDLAVSKLASQRKCAIKNVALINPPATVASPTLTLVLKLLASEPNQKSSLGADWGAIARVRGALLSHRLSQIAMKSGLMKVDLDSDSRVALDDLRASAANIRDQIDWDSVYCIRGSIWLSDLELDVHVPEPLILVVDPASDWGYGSILQYDEKQTLIGGFSIQVDQAGRGIV